MQFKQNLFKTVLCLLFLITNTAYSDETTDLVNSATKRAEKLKIELPDVTASKAYKEGMASGNYIKSESFQKRVEVQSQRLKSLLSKNYNIDLREEEKDQSSEAGLFIDERIFICVSSSIPLSTLRAYVADVDHLSDKNVTLVLRGFVGSIKKVKPTLDFIRSVVLKDPTCSEQNPDCDVYKVSVDIDPLIFRKFGIDRVPAVIYARNLNMFEPSKSIGLTGNLKNRPSHQVFYGDSKLNTVFKTFNNERKSMTLQRLIKHLENRGWYGKR